MKQLNGNKGFGLIECVISMFLICIVVLGMAAHIGVSMAAMQTDTMSSVSGSLLQDKIEGMALTYTLKDGTITQAPANLSHIRKVTLTLLVRSSTIDPMTGDYKRFELTSDITPRNLNL